MKKKKLVGLTASLALGTALILTMTACGSSTNDLIGKEYAPTAPSMSSVSLTALDDYTVTGLDKYGLATAYQYERLETPTADGKNYTFTYLLYDVVANKAVATKTVNQASPSSSSVFAKVTDGIYRAANTSADGEVVDYNYYAKTGVAKTTEEYVLSASGSIVTFKDGTKLIVQEDGSVSTIPLSIQPVFTPEVFDELGDVYIQTIDDNGVWHRVWSDEGKILREVNINKELEVPSTVNDQDMEMWFIGNSYFVQYSVRLPDDAAKYDYADGASKYDLVTKSYNFKTGKVKEYNVDFVVSSYNPNPASADGVFLSVQTISDKQISASRTYQYYGEDLKVRVDLQKLLPDCNKVEIDGDYVVLSSPAAINVYQDGELVGFADAAADVTFQDGYFVQTVGSNKYIYTLDGSRIFEGVTSSASLGEKLYHNIFNGIIYYTVKEEVTTTSASGTTTQAVEIVYAYANGSETRLGEGTYSNRWITIENTVDDETTSTVYYAGYSDAIVSNLSGSSDVEASATNGETSYFLYRYNETVESGSGDSVTTETVTKYVLVTVTEPAK